MTTEEARQKLRELTALVESLRQEAMLHPDDAEAGAAWRASCRDLDGAIAALAELLGDRENAARFRKEGPDLSLPTIGIDWILTMTCYCRPGWRTRIADCRPGRGRFELQTHV